MNKSMEGSANKARKSEEKNSGVSVIKVAPIGLKTAGGGGFKKGGFKSAFRRSEDEKKDEGNEGAGDNSSAGSKIFSTGVPDADSDSDYDYELYDPRKPTGCPPGCKGRG